MGSWSESCGVSGIEIAEGDEAYVCRVAKTQRVEEFGPFYHYVLASPLVKGVYRDYGGLELTDTPEMCSLLSKTLNKEEPLTVGSEWEDYGERFWVRADVFDNVLPSLERDFGYVYDPDRKESVPSKTIASQTEWWAGQIALAIAEAKEKYDSYKAFAEQVKEKDHETVLKAAKMLAEHAMMSRLSYSKSPLKNLLSQAIRDGQSTDAIVEAELREYRLYGAMFELRKMLVPSERVGPQHGGLFASLAFHEACVSIEKNRKKEYECN